MINTVKVVSYILPTGQCEYLIVTLADSMLEPIIPKARESKRFIDK